MRRKWVAVSVAILCLVGCRQPAVDQSQRPAATGPVGAEKKAEALEQNGGRRQQGASLSIRDDQQA